jgi:hypothetical protein
VVDGRRRVGRPRRPTLCCISLTTAHPHHTALLLGYLGSRFPQKFKYAEYGLSAFRDSFPPSAQKKKAFLRPRRRASRRRGAAAESRGPISATRQGLCLRPYPPCLHPLFRPSFFAPASNHRRAGRGGPISSPVLLCPPHSESAGRQAASPCGNQALRQRHDAIVSCCPCSRPSGWPCPMARCRWQRPRPRLDSSHG